MVQLKKVEDGELAEQFGVELGSAFLTYDFVLVTDEAAADLRRRKAEEAMAGLGRRFKFIDDRPVPDED